MAQGQQLGHLPIKILGGTPVMRPSWSSGSAGYAIAGITLLAHFTHLQKLVFQECALFMSTSQVSAHALSG